MPIGWSFSRDIDFAGRGKRNIAVDDAMRQAQTVRAILSDLQDRPGIVLADEVGMGKTYVALGVVASILPVVAKEGRPVVVMVPPGLVSKWEREWDQFRHLCVAPKGLDWVRTETAFTAAEFFNKLDDHRSRRPHVIWMPTTAFSAGLSDPWFKLALIRLARSRTKLDDGLRARLVKWSTELVRLRSLQALDTNLVERLLSEDISSWRTTLVGHGLRRPEEDDPVPAHLVKHADQLDWVRFTTLLRDGTIPGSRGGVSDERVNQARVEFNAECQRLHTEWLHCVRWRAPLLVLDEAHHAKNDGTRLASLFRSTEAADLLESADASERPALYGKFDRMLFLTATPFQLGHAELLRVLKTFGAASWADGVAPLRSRDFFFESMRVLEERLDANRIAGRRLDAAWGRLGTGPSETEGPGPSDSQWWKRVSCRPADGLEKDIRTAVNEYRTTKRAAENDPSQPWQSLRAWVIRHNRPQQLPGLSGLARRELLIGREIQVQASAGAAGGPGLSIGADPLPFLLAARAQGELASSAKGRAFFAEGLCSSYEAFHHTRELRSDARDLGDDGSARQLKKAQRRGEDTLVPISWYERQVELAIPTRDHSAASARHPKVQPVVARAVDLWLSGEKVLVFCFYRQTARALRDHISRGVRAATSEMVAKKLGLRGPKAPSRAWEWLERVSRRLGTPSSPFHLTLQSLLQRPFQDSQFRILRKHRDELVELLMAYVRTPTFLARHLPIEEPAVRAALEKGEARREVITSGLEALTHALVTAKDGSGMTMLQRIREFLEFAVELAERSRVKGRGDESRSDPLREYLDAVSVYVSKSKSKSRDNEDDDPDAGQRRGVRAQATVRLVYGDTSNEVRERLMLAFNSPLFPEILVSSSVLGEGVDLHRFCRYVIHHDLCWNPSTLEQRTGRLDRIRCKAEVSQRPIVIFQPFLSGSADEKMFRVVRDRERWFQIVMGQRYEFDEATSERYANRPPLPDDLARELVFDLSRFRPHLPTMGPGDHQKAGGRRRTRIAQ